ncbi:MAG: hypothetical protein K2Y39_05500 [Candidatus Obscuribacterales bacterium]|nr:hypothetical protein [Candidatus Obscuribacterales bacterium]
MMRVRKGVFTVVILIFCCAFLRRVNAQAIEADNNRPQKTTPNYDEKTIFSSSALNTNSLPKYRIETKPADKIRAFIQAGTPELEQVRLIGSLRGKQREDVVRTYEKGRAELSVINQEFSEMRKRMPNALVEKMLSKEEPQMDMMTKSEDFDLLLRARNMLQKLRSKRLSIWEEIQGKLSPAQLEELEKLKSGELPPELMEQNKN